MQLAKEQRWPFNLLRLLKHLGSTNWKTEEANTLLDVFIQAFKNAAQQSNEDLIPLGQQSNSARKHQLWLLNLLPRDSQVLCSCSSKHLWYPLETDSMHLR